jgi:hypothetical protein
MDMGKSISYLFEDEDWLSKIGIGALIMFVPILNFAGIGYEAQVIRNVARGEARPLPQWNDLGALFMDGLWLWLARFIYGLPLLFLFFCPFALIVPLIATAQNDEDMTVRLPFVFLICGGSFLLIMTYALVVGLFSPAVTALYIRRGAFAACFDFPAIARFIRDNFGDYLTAWLGALAVGLLLNVIASPVLVFVGFIPCLGQIVYFLLLGGMVMTVLLVSGHLVGQLLQADAARSGGLAAPPRLNP